MNKTVMEMKAIMDGDIDVLEHYGMPRRSGRYPWGSGDNPYQHQKDFLSRVEELKKNGWVETPENIAKEFGVNTAQYRMEKKVCLDERRMDKIARVESLKADGLNNSEIGRKMGISESAVRSLLDEKAKARTYASRNTADFLKEKVREKGMIDVGADVYRELNISKTQFETALYILEGEGYPIYKGGIQQATNPSQQINQKVLCPPGTKHSEIYDFKNVHTITDYISRDGGDSYEKKFHYPESMDSKRLAIRYKEDGGIDKDGIVEIRPGVKDLSLGNSHYAQVRILVDGTHYIKGMAVYSNDLPPGVDVMFNTNKSKSTPKMDVLKEIKKDPDNPFGSAIKDAQQGGQYWYEENGKKKLGLINKRADEGDWSDWKDALPSQFLAKQSKSLAKKQLNLAKEERMKEFEEIMSLSNPTIKKHLLEKFASNCDSAAVSLKAAALPGQKYHVIIPITSLKDDEIYAPNYPDGTKLALVRYPHGGTFEIPIVKVNNKHAVAKKLLGKDVIDAVGINSKVAERLSGADFDGDTVMCIPTNDPKTKIKITSTRPLKGLEGFDPKVEYGPESYKGRTIKLMKNPATNTDATQSEMGSISNLITDMTLAGASEKELARAVRHSMVVIDAAKHKLDYKRSEKDNNIAELKRLYQVKYDKNGRIRYGGASTLLSKSSGDETVNKRQGEAKINIKGKEWYDPSRPEGALIYKDAKDLYYVVKTNDKKDRTTTIKTVDGKKIKYSWDDKEAVKKYTPKEVKDKEGNIIGYTSQDGSIKYKTKARTQKSTKMLEVDNAEELVSTARHPMELIYADYANSMKALANKARKEMVFAGKIEYSRSAKEKYRAEYDSLMAKLNDAKLNTIKERAAQRMAYSEVADKQKTISDMTKGDLKKARQMAISKAREEVGSLSRRDRNIEITDREWEAIQAGAISETKLKQILNNTDIDKLRERATPRATVELSPVKINRIKAMSASYTNQQIAEKLGISPATVTKYLKEEIRNGN
ncbi:winged helix-turn-helix domain-containing protein [Enterococcus cecorum]|uniref:winged helix-turn-helix domain-containing protein n=1 Tax=Enterococcus cecorum TaxID=44008 RepID=UPI0022D20CEA|nr:winged helix-turn-helix domain-containing protein [Enterococcus cecorum]CAI3256337.1 winged helix-turn-helix domain-containing protein [Enterococcus cecorum]CAI3256886.1 winged helix-turn-helix domain-containing protein [Enterococcus cecorum]CAI3257100.1 winged helix-turn-helix domain-containing protein [Enterococcus cecorum]CAI3257718.1 winged helix-turn-helix domain-containing protein [Enterococcus cecorum]CAI3257753.1 winged helix-turn-helix domain-containing protein [Enterococcus cecoru